MRYRKLYNNQTGSAAVEAAFVLPLFLLFIIGVIELGRAYWVQHTLQLSVSDAGRYVLVQPTASDNEIETRARSSLYGLNGNNVTYNISTMTQNGINYKVITARHPFTFAASGLLGLSPITISMTSRNPLLP